jgi:predicted transcriptional regulator
MIIEVPVGVEERLRSLAASQGRDVGALLEEAVRQYLEAAAITDVDAGEVAETQDALLAELPGISD